jgi:hypothetical protein
MAEKVVAQGWQWRRSNGDGGAAMAKVAQLLRQRSNGDGGTATAMVAQRRLRWHSNGNGSAAMAIELAVH